MQDDQVRRNDGASRGWGNVDREVNEAVTHSSVEQDLYTFLEFS